MLEISLIVIVLICGLIALQASDSARRTRADVTALQEETAADTLRLQQTIAEQDQRIQRLIKAAADLRAQMETVQASHPAAPPPPDNIPTPRAVKGA